MAYCDLDDAVDEFDIVLVDYTLLGCYIVASGYTPVGYCTAGELADCPGYALVADAAGYEHVHSVVDSYPDRAGCIAVDFAAMVDRCFDSEALVVVDG
mmetsp:Transcript_1845/g.2723  ORF Transcript_1845/g.2723 Transcript_1845/m.2723 type:complete len:98 (+) Transcript_1845:480-773(+)